MAMAIDDTSRRHSKWVELFNPIAYGPILRSLSLYLTVGDFLVLCQVCKSLHIYKNLLIQRFLNINVQLANFVWDPILFRSQMGKYGVCISGPFALNFLEIGHRDVSYLDVFVKDGTDADQFTKYLSEIEKYEGDGSEAETARRLYTCMARPGKKFRITLTTGPPMKTVLTSSSATAWLNLITWNKAYAIFPRQTLLGHQFYLLRGLDNAMGSDLKELAENGWTTRDVIWPDLSEVETARMEGLRRIGDGSALILPLGSDSVTEPLTPDFVVEYSQFNVSGRDIRHKHKPWACFLTVAAKTLASPAVRYEYTTANSEWHGYAMERLKRWGWLELYKADPRSRSYMSQTSFPMVSDIPQPFRMPESWDYADDQMLEWYREWEQKRKE